MPNFQTKNTNSYFNLFHMQWKIRIFTLVRAFFTEILKSCEKIIINNNYFFQLVYRIVDLRLLKRVPIDTLMFSLSAATIFHIQMFHPKSISKLGSKFISAGSLNRLVLLGCPFWLTVYIIPVVLQHSSWSEHKIVLRSNHTLKRDILESIPARLV